MFTIQYIINKIFTWLVNQEKLRVWYARYDHREGTEVSMNLQKWSGWLRENSHLKVMVCMNRWVWNHRYIKINYRHRFKDGQMISEHMYTISKHYYRDMSMNGIAHLSTILKLRMMVKRCYVLSKILKEQQWQTLSTLMWFGFQPTLTLVRFRTIIYGPLILSFFCTNTSS